MKKVHPIGSTSAKVAGRDRGVVRIGGVSDRASCAADDSATARAGEPIRVHRPALKHILQFETVEGRLLMSGGHPVHTARVAEMVAPVNDPATVPITQLTGTYMGQDGGLYGGGSNTPPPSEASALAVAAGRVVPRDGHGRPSASGKVGVLAIGQSTTLLEFNVFQALARRDPTKRADIAFVNGAQNGQVLQNWAGGSGPWKVAMGRLKAAGISASQVQVVWIDLAQIYSWYYGDFSARTTHYAQLMTSVIRTAKRDFPNLQVAFLSSRIYGGYGPQGVDPEPYAYESAFGVRLAIEQQIAGSPALNANPSRGRVVAPVIAWGPYFWADGTIPRASDGLTWQPGDFFADGVHPSASGDLKASQLLLNFFANDPATRPWYLA